MSLKHFKHLLHIEIWYNADTILLNVFMGLMARSKEHLQASNMSPTGCGCSSSLRNISNEKKSRSVNLKHIASAYPHDFGHINAMTGCLVRATVPNEQMIGWRRRALSAHGAIFGSISGFYNDRSRLRALLVDETNNSSHFYIYDLLCFHGPVTHSEWLFHGLPGSLPTSDGRLLCRSC